MKKSWGRVLGLSLTVLLILSIMTGSLSGAYPTQAEGSLFTDVTGSMDFSKLMQQYFNNGVLSSAQTKTYERRTVIVSLDSDSLTDLSGDASVSDFAATAEGQEKTQELYAEQDRLLESIREAGIDCTLEHRYVAIDNAIAIEVDTAYVSELRKMSGVRGVVITRAYAAPQTVETSGSGAAVNNITSVYGTGVYDSSGALKDGLDGSGMVVAIIDTGLDYTHAAFRDMPDGTNPVRFTEADIANILATKDLCAEEKQLLSGGKLTVSDVYINAKVPFAYDYADNDADVYPSYSNHGTHVAGIVAGHDASGYTDKDGNHVDEEFIGVAPEAQLVICKVFTDDLEDSDLGGAETEDILTALEDCMLLGVDVINMSLGTTCGFTTSDDGDDEGEYLHRIYTAIGEQGINLLCAASNDYSAGYGSVFGTNLATNPDSGTIGSPSTYASALSVASISGKKSDYLVANGTLPVFFENSNDENSLPFDFIQQMLGDRTSGEFEYVVIPGVGLASDYTASIQELVKGRVALVKRGDSTFQEKVEIAKSFGAIAIIVYNNVAGTVRMSLGDVEEPIPAISIGMNAGEAMVSAATDRQGKLTLDETYKAGPFMSDFSSWGSTSDLKLKPEITAHGGEITSAVPGGYTEMSGTSMACPNMAGVTALVRAYVKNLWPELSAVEVTRRVNQLMMSTATTVYDQEGLPYSPRKQGAGLGSLDNSRFTQAYLWTDNASIDYRPKVELGDDKEKRGVYSLSFNLTNFGTTALSFKTQSLFMTETLAMGGLAVAEQAYMLTDEAALWTVDGRSVADGETFEVAAGSTVTLTLTLSLSDAEKTYIDESFENGMYVEGFAKLLSTDEDQCDLVLPFMGFYGDWSQAPMLDYDAYELAGYQQDSSIPDDEKPQASVWATQPYITYYNDEYVIPMGSFLYNQDENEDQILPDQEHNAISCFNEYFGDDSINNYLTAYRFKGLYAGLLRNARTVNYKLINANTGEVLMDETSYRVGKAYSNGGSSHPALVELEIDPLELDMASGEKYTMTFEFFLDYEDGRNSTKNTFSFDFYTDYEAPVLQDVRVRYYDYKDGNKTRQRIYLDLDVFDNHYAQSVMLTYLEDGELKLATDYVTPVRNANKNGTTTVSIEITDIYEKYRDRLYVQVDDYALNHSVYWLNLSEDNQDLAPDYFELAEGEDQITLDVYETHTVKLSYEGDGNISNFKWSSNDRRIVDVKNGEIVGLAPGTAHVTVEGSGGYKKTIAVTVTETRRTLTTPSISFGSVRDGDGTLKKAQGSLSMYPGMDFELEIVGDPWYYPVEELELKWESTNPVVATVDEHGHVRILEKGTAVIKASIVVDGVTTAYTATVTLRVQDPFEVSSYSLVKYHGAGGVVVIPTDKNIMMIGEEAFKDNDTITEIVIPKTVTSIGKNAFENCTALKRVYFVDTEAQEIADADVSVIYQQAFYGCTALELVDFSNVKVLTLGRECFANCTALSEIRRMDKVSTAYENCFANCTSLVSLDLSGLYVCGTGAFRGCTALTDIKTGWATRLGNYAFADCIGLKELALSAAQVGDYAFEGCTDLRRVYITADAEGEAAAISIGAYAFAGCSSLTSFTCDEGCRVVSMGDAALADTALTAFTMPSGLTAWGAGILAGTPVTELTVGDDFDLDTVHLMGIPFDRLNVRLEDGCTRYVLADGVLYSSDMTRLLLVMGDTAQVEIPATVTSIGDHAFAGSRVTSLTIPATVKSIGESAFADSSLSRIVFAEGTTLTTIPDHAFSGSKLASITIPASVTSIGDSAFANSSLATIAFAGNTVERIGDMAFSGCIGLETVILPDGIAVMGESVFRDCTQLTEVVLPSVRELGDYTFYGCADLHTVRFGEHAETVGDFTCYGCTALTTVDLGGVTVLGDDTFFGCTALESIDLKNVTVIGNETFTGCTALGTVIGLERVTIIGDMAFYNNNAIKELNLAAATHIGKGAFAVENGGVAYTTLNIPSAEVIGAMAFVGGKETTVTIPASLTTLGYGAFSSSRLLQSFAVEEGNETFFTADGVLYVRVLDGTGFELCAFPGAKSSEDGSYTVLDGTVSIKAYAFCGLSKRTAPGAVVLPWSVKIIGASAFYDSGIREYTFQSIQAPTLSCVYREDVMEIMEAAAVGSTAGATAVNGLFYANFDTLFVYYLDMVGGTSDLVMHIPENGKGYDNYIYSTYFGESTSLGILMDDTTRSAITAIDSLESAETVRSWLSWTVNEENLRRVEEFSAAAKEARRLYGNILDETQLAFVTAEQVAKLEAVETALREVKALFGIQMAVSDVRPVEGYKKEYVEGETFDMTGLALTVVYDDGSVGEGDISRLTPESALEPLTVYDLEIRFRYRWGEGESDYKIVRIPVTVRATDSDETETTGPDETETLSPVETEAEETTDEIVSGVNSADIAARTRTFLILGLVLLVVGIVALVVVAGLEKKGVHIHGAIRWIVYLMVAAGIVCLLAGWFNDSSAPDANTQVDVRIHYNANGGSFDDNKVDKTIGYSSGSFPLNIGTQVLSSGNVGMKELSGYIFEGWFLPVTDESGELLYEDEAEEIVKTGEAFDFTKRLDAGEDIYLYAKWSRDARVQILLAGTDVTDKEGRTHQVGDLLKELSFQNGEIQKFSGGDRLMSLTRKSYTFVEYYEDEACTRPVSWPITEADAGENKCIYARFVEGDWTIVSDVKGAKSMLESLAGNRQYLLVADIDLQGAVLSGMGNAVAATVVGEGHTISNFTVERKSVKAENAALFGAVKAGAVIRDLDLSGVTLQLNLPSSQDVYFIYTDCEAGAQISGLQVQGRLNINHPADALVMNIQPSYHDAWILAGDQSPLTDGSIRAEVVCTVDGVEYRYPEN